MKDQSGVVSEKEGDDLLVAVEDGHIALTSGALVPRDQAWYWSPEWQSGERTADADLAAGRHGQPYMNEEEFLYALSQGVEDPSALR